MRSSTRAAARRSRACPLEDPRGNQLQDHRLHGVERGEDPGDRPRPCAGVIGQQARVMLGNVEDDRAGLEQGEIALFVGGNLAERMQGQMRRFLHRAERHQTNLVGQARFLQRPAHARIAGQSLAAVGRAFKGGDDDAHRCRFPSAAYRRVGWPALSRMTSRRRRTRHRAEKISGFGAAAQIGRMRRRIGGWRSHTKKAALRRPFRECGLRPRQPRNVNSTGFQPPLDW